MKEKIEKLCPNWECLSSELPLKDGRDRTQTGRGYLESMNSSDKSVRTKTDQLTAKKRVKDVNKCFTMEIFQISKAYGKVLHQMSRKCSWKLWWGITFPRRAKMEKTSNTKYWQDGGQVKLIYFWWELNACHHFGNLFGCIHYR